MPPRRVALLALLPALLAPARAAANLLQSDPVTVGAYRLQLRVANHGARAGGDVVLWRRTRTSRQEHRYHIDALNYSYTNDLRSARVRGTLRAGGHIDLVFHGGAPARVNGADPCSDDGAKGRRGRLTGKFRFPVGDKYFKTLRTIGRTAVLGPPRSNVGDDPVCAFGTEGGAVYLASEDRGAVRFSLVDTGGPIFVNFTVRSPSGPAGRVIHSIDVRGPHGAFTESGVDTQADDDTAHLAAIPPFLTGALDYISTAVDDRTNFGTVGTVSGTLRARFDSIGAVAPPAGRWALSLQDSGH